VVPVVERGADEDPGQWAEGDAHVGVHGPALPQVDRAGDGQGCRREPERQLYADAAYAGNELVSGVDSTPRQPIHVSDAVVNRMELPHHREGVGCAVDGVEGQARLRKM